jgi:hypothetical protein
LALISAPKSKWSPSLYLTGHHFARTEHKVTVEHSVDVKRPEEIALRWAGELGVDPAKIMGRTGLTARARRWSGRLCRALCAFFGPLGKVLVVFCDPEHRFLGRYVAH